jgi:spore germination cell wall hydrolase CwlJ-like protein
LTPLLCIAVAAYLEARGEGPDGMLAVADVIMERVNDPRWPDDPCSVVEQPKQFAFLPFERVEEIILAEHDAAWSMALDAARTAMAGEGLGSGATHFHWIGEHPYWTKNAILVGRMGEHLFWRINKEN